MGSAGRSRVPGKLPGALVALAMPAVLVASGCGGTVVETANTTVAPTPATAEAPTTTTEAHTLEPPTTVAATPASAETGTATTTEPEPDDTPDRASGDGRPAPDVRFDYFDGTEGSLADFAGTPTVVNFWASWCPPCIVELPAFEAVHRELGSEVAFLGLNVGDEPSAARRLATQTGVTYPLGEDPDSTIFQSFRGIGMPTTVLVDSEGMIVYMVASRLKAQDLRALIAEYLGV